MLPTMGGLLGFGPRFRSGPANLNPSIYTYINRRNGRIAWFLHASQDLDNIRRGVQRAR